MFKDRKSAGELLAGKLQQYNKNAIVLAIPRGGVPVALPIAKMGHLPLTLVLTKKIGHPDNKEFAIGACSLTDYFIMADNVVSDAYIKTEIENIRQRLNIMQHKFKHDFTSLSIRNKTIILVDDGMATGITAFHTVQLLRKYNPKKIILAVPIASSSAVEMLQKAVDELVVLEVASYFQAVGFFYKDFNEVTDDEVSKLLEELVGD